MALGSSTARDKQNKGIAQGAKLNRRYLQHGESLENSMSYHLAQLQTRQHGEVAAALMRSKRRVHLAQE